MPTVTKFANANAVVVTGWTSPTSAYADDTVYATAAPAKNAAVTSDFGFPAFSTSDIPEGATINSVTAEIQKKSSTTGSSGATIGLQLNNNGTLLGTEQTSGMGTADALVTHQVTTGITEADLRSANLVKARVAGKRAASNTAVTWSVDYVKLTVDYSPGATPLVVAASTVATSASSPSLTQAHTLAVANASSGTTAQSPTLSATVPTVTLTVASSTVATSSSSPSLSPSVTLTVSGSTVASSAGSPTLTQAHTLTVASATSASLAGSPTLSESVTLVVAGSVVAASAGTPTLTQAHTLAVQHATTASSADAVTLSAGLTLTVQSATSASSAGSPTLEGLAQTLVVQSATVASLAGSVALSGVASLLAVQDATSGTTAGSVTLTVDGESEPVPEPVVESPARAWAPGEYSTGARYVAPRTPRTRSPRRGPTE